MMARHRHKFPFEIRAVEPEVNAELLQYFYGERTGYVQVGPEKYFFPHKYQQEAEAFYNFEARASDVWIVTVPRSGTTWTQELVWLVANNLDFEGARTRLLTERFPFFEFSLFVHPEIKNELLLENAGQAKKLAFIERFSQPGYEVLPEKCKTQRRFIKTHFPFSLLPPSVMQQKCKIIYVARQPMAVAVSYYHLNRLYRTQGFRGDFERYWNYFERGLGAWLPYHSHIREAQAVQHLPNVLFLHYEEMRQDLRVTIEKVADFLECKVEATGLEQLVNHLDISNFRLNPSVNGHEMDAVGVLNKGEQAFVRSGCLGGLQQEFANNPELLARAQRWIEHNQL